MPEGAAPRFLRRCAELVPVLEGNAARGEAERRLPDATLEAARRAGILGAAVPVALGGDGLGLPTLTAGTRLLGQACPASAWTLSFYLLHGWLLARFGAEVRETVFADGPVALAPAPLAPTGTLSPTVGGYRLTGTWAWATGIAHAEWVIVHAVERGPDLTSRFAVVPRHAVTVADVWHTSGMRATGSNTIHAEDVFVPGPWTLPAGEFLDGGAAGGRAAEGDGMAGLPVPTVLALMASAPAMGAADAAVNHYRERLMKRVLAYSIGDRAAEQPAAQIRLAAAQSRVAAAGDHWDATVGSVARAGGRLDLHGRAQARLCAAATVAAARQIIELVCVGAGASVYLLDHPLQRLQRDVETLKGHVIFDWDRTAELAGRVSLGLRPGPLDMV